MKKLLATFVLLLVLLPAAAAAQMSLTAPVNGKVLNQAPTFEWSPGRYDQFLFYSQFNYSGPGYMPVSFWTEDTSLSMPAGWWEMIAESDPASPCYWAVVGVNPATSRWAIAGIWTFTRTLAQIIETIPPGEADEMIRAYLGSDTFVLLDVRTPEEYAAERIEGAANLDFYSDTFAADLGQLDRSLTYLIYCRSGSRSGLALAQMETLGFGEVHNLDGGINLWKFEGYPVVAGKKKGRTVKGSAFKLWIRSAR